MKIELAAKDLSSALSLGAKLVKRPNVTNLIVNKNIYIQQVSDTGAIYENMIPGNVEKKGKISIPTDILENIAKVKTAKLVIDAKQTLNFSSPNTKLSGSDIPLAPESEEPLHFHDNNEKVVELPQKLQSHILILLAHCALNSYFEKTLPISIATIDKYLHVGCADVTLSCVGKINIPTKTKLDTSIPASYGMILRDIPGTDLIFAIDEKRTVIKTSTVYLQLPTLQTDKVAELDMILSLEKEKSLSKFKVKAEDLRGALENLIISFEKGTPIRFLVKSGVARLEYKTSRGIFKNTIKVDSSKDVKFSVDAETLMGRMSKASGEMEVSVRKSSVGFSHSLSKKMDTTFICTSKVE